ncbi:MAG TPA: DUF481 domain-containing protein [Flammeovirgaceae bacterium]|nr:DUF481 domain-containing protein [Flammeovirgaceae bacterium]
MKRFVPFFLLILSFLLPVAAYAQKTDTVIFYNGDRAVCEIKNLSQGKLTLSTVAMGTISVEWRKVAYLSSDKNFEIVLKDHSTIYGHIVHVDSARNVTLTFGIFTETVPIDNIVSLFPIKKSFWARLDGDFSMGFSYTQGTENLQLNSSGNVHYRKKKAIHSLSFNINASANPNTQSQKQDGGYRLEYYHRHRIYNSFEARWERNTELGLNSRLITMLGVGYSPIHNSYSVLSMELGASANREFTVADSVTNNVEAVVRLSYNLYIFSSPKIFINIKSATYPSLTVQNRLRSNFDGSIKWEIFNDFTFNITYWGNYDSHPIDENALNYDWGLTTGIGYTF